MSRVYRVPMPEGGDERSVIWERLHGCKDAPYFRSALEDEEIDVLIFPVGLLGQGMPHSTPFVVVSGNPCGVCGKHVQAWFEWAPKLVIL